MPRFAVILAAAISCATGAGAQPTSGEPGACMLETAAGEPINIGVCTRLPMDCDAAVCVQRYFWDADEFSTEISGGGAGMVREGTAMNGQEAYAPVALVQSDPRDCIYNTVSDAVFCFMPGAEAAALAGQGNAARDRLLSLALAQGSTAGPEHGAGPHLSGGKKSAEAGPVDLLAAFQGKYRPAPEWDCTEVGRDGGATAVEGDFLLGLETSCQLVEGQAVGAHGAALFRALCSGEGETWEDEIILRRDQWGSLAVLRSDAVTVWQACD